MIQPLPTSQASSPTTVLPALVYPLKEAIF